MAVDDFVVAEEEDYQDEEDYTDGDYPDEEEDCDADKETVDNDLVNDEIMIKKLFMTMTRKLMVILLMMIIKTRRKIATMTG